MAYLSFDCLMLFKDLSCEILADTFPKNDEVVIYFGYLSILLLSFKEESFCMGSNFGEEVHFSRIFVLYSYFSEGYLLIE